MRYISDPQIRRSIRAETTKIESYNDFLDWITFGGPVIKSGDPVEQEKQVKYASLIANAIMLSNVEDLTGVLSAMADDGIRVTPRLGRLSQSIYPKTNPALRKVLSRHGGLAGATGSCPAALRNSTVTGFYTYPEPTPA